MREGRKLMRRGSFRRLVFAAGGVVVASVARADAPYGSDSQYGTFDPLNTTITDNNTGLTWQRSPPSNLVSFGAAESYCAALVLSQMTGWRVPSYKELLTLVDESPHPEYDGTTNVYKAIDSHAFGFQYTPLTSPYYWSSSSLAAAPGYAYLVDFRSGATVTLDKSLGTLVRCVHDP
jgi:Protein of unknown function (DUF1566)